MALKVVKGEDLIITPLPKTERGFGIHIDGTLQKTKRLLYASGKHVVIRPLESLFGGSTFSGHNANVTVAKFSPNGEWVASGDSNGQVMIWGSANQNLKNKLIVNRGVLDISWGGDNSQIVAVGEGGDGIFAKVFRIDSANSIGEIVNHCKKILSCALRPSRPFYLATVSEDKDLNVYKGVPFQYEKKHRIHSNFPNCVRYSPDGSHFASVGSDKIIALFNGEGEHLRTIDTKTKGAHKGSIYSCSFSPDGERLLTASGDKSLKIWDMKSMECTNTFTVGKDVNDMQVACLWLEGFLISISLSGAINFLEENSNDIKTVWNGHQKSVESIAVDPARELIYSSGGKGKIIVWNIKEETSTSFESLHNEKPINSIALSSSTEKIFSVGFDDNLCESCTSSLKLIKRYKLDGQPTCIAAANKNDDIFIAGTTKKSLYFKISAEMGKMELKFIPNCIDIHPDDNIIAVGGDNGIIYLYEVDNEELKQITEIKKHSSAINAIKYSSCGEYLISLGNEKKIYIWKTDSDYSKPVNSRGWAYHDGKVVAVCCQEDFNTVATGAWDESIILWSNPQKGNTAKRKFITPGHIGGVSTLRNYKDNKFISTGEDKCIRIWNY